MANLTQSKLVSEILTYSFDFANQCVYGEALATPVVTIEVFSGVDSDPASMLEGAATLTDTTITQQIKLGNPGVIYVLICSVDGDGDRVYKDTRYLAVLNDVGVGFAYGRGLAIVGDLPDTFAYIDYYETLDIIDGYEPFGPVTVDSGNYPIGWTPTISGRYIVTSGIANDTGTFTFRYKLYDFAGQIAYSDQVVYIPPVDLYGTIPSVGYVGIAYSGQYDTRWGMTPYVLYEITSGTLMPGVLLDDSTCEFAGIPTTGGTYTFDTTVTDSINEQDTEQATVLIYAPKYIACGSASKVGFSIDGATWVFTGVGSTSNIDYRGIAYDDVNELYVVAGYDNISTAVIHTSPDFSVWTSRTVPFSAGNKPAFLTYGNGILVCGTYTAGISDGELAYSTNGGVSWTMCTYDAGLGPFGCCAYSDSLDVFVAGTNNGTGNSLRSTDGGINWTTVDFGANSLDGITFGNSEFMSVCAQTGAGGETWTSPTGTSWTFRSSDGGVSWGLNGVVWDGILYYASAQGDPTVRGMYTTTNGDLWTQMSNSFTGQIFYCVEYFVDMWLFGGTNGVIAYSTDGSTFASASTTGLGSSVVYDIFTLWYLP